MASGKKNYFRHSVNAFEDEKIQRAIDLIGYEGYAYYFILIEILAKKCENEFINPIRIHQQTLRIVWRKQSKSCKKVVEKLQESGLFVATFTGSFIEFDIPNLSKYLGKYKTKTPANVPNKSKVKESKEVQNVVFDFEEIYKKYPKRVGKGEGIKKLKSKIKTQKDFDNLKRAFKNYMTQLDDTGQFAKNWVTFCNNWKNFLEENGWEKPQGDFSDKLKEISSCVDPKIQKIKKMVFEDASCFISGQRSGAWPPYLDPDAEKYRKMTLDLADEFQGFKQLGRDQFQASQFFKRLKRGLKL